MTFSASRRGLLIGASSPFTGLLTGAHLPAPAGAAPRWTAVCGPSSVSSGFGFLKNKFDEYGTGDALRVPRSYTGGFFETPAWTFVSSFTYDDALVILAWLARGDAERAVLLGDTLLYAQRHDPIGDGRTRASYQPDSFTVLNGTLDIGSPAAYTGNQAWAGMAFAHLCARTGQRRFLDGALRLGRWIFSHTLDVARAPHGYTGGRTADDQPLTYKATEHNIDVGAFFTMLATLTGDRVWRDRATTAFSFVAAMQEFSTGHLWNGTDPDGVTTNRRPIPLDVQVWALLATLDDRYRRSVSWALDHLSASDAGVHGVSFSDVDTSKVWLEGTGQTALALAARRGKGDALLSKRLLWHISRAQGSAGGIPAASSDGLDTGFGDLYYRSFHTGATAWFLLAALSSNPFRL